MISGRKYSYCILSMTLLILSLIASFNYWQDPANLFLSERQYKEFSEALTEGHILAVRGNYDERIFKKNEIAAKKGTDCDIVILGSSRVMAFSKENLGDNLAVENLGVSGAVLQDDISIWHIYEEVNENNSVKIVIIEAAAWLLNVNNGQNSWKALSDDYVTAMQNLGTSIDVPHDYDKISKLISKKYTQLSYNQWHNEKKIFPLYICDSLDEIKDNWHIIYPDGSRGWSRELYQKDANDLAKAFVKGKVYQVEEFDTLDTRLQNTFALFMDYLQAKNIKVILYFPPYHPYVYKFLKDNSRYSQVFKADSWFKDYATTHNIEVFGSYNPADMGLNEDDFLDGGHLKRESFLKFGHNMINKQ